MTKLPKLAGNRFIAACVWQTRGGWLAGLALAVVAYAEPIAAAESRIEVHRDDQQGQTAFVIDGKEAFVYCHRADLDLPHFYPVRSPSGRPLTVQRTEPYPHHRSVWFADTVELAGARPASFYNAWHSRITDSAGKGVFSDRIRHVELAVGKTEADKTEVTARLVWEMDAKVPVLDERRQLRIAALGEGEYLVDIEFTLTASYGDVRFTSDAVHYAWPYVRMSSEWSVDQGGTIINSQGAKNQSGTNNQTAQWVDYSNTVAGQTEGLAIFSHPQNAHPHRWLTRDYGTFGPRRADEKSGRPFTLSKGESLTQRVGILVHRGDTVSGRVAERYAAYCESSR